MLVSQFGIVVCRKLESTIIG